MVGAKCRPVAGLLPRPYQPRAQGSKHVEQPVGAVWDRVWPDMGGEPMGRYVIRRLLQLIPVFFGTTFIIFAGVFMLPGTRSGRCSVSGHRRRRCLIS